jgi:tetraacyldisaccharide 4'-kinase
MDSANWFRGVMSGKATGLRAGLARRLAALIEPVYAAIIRRKNRRFDSGKLTATEVHAPVVSVGNLTVGGTGKTPLVCWLAEWFLRKGVAVTLVSRGYGAKKGRPNDEAMELAARLPDVPHVQNPNRIAAAESALRGNPRQVLILDDAFQHRRIARDLDIVLLDALEPFGYGHLLPRGLLREPVDSLTRAQVVALSRADAVDEAAREAIRKRVQAVAPRAIWLELSHRPTMLVNSAGERRELWSLFDQRVAAFCGIGNPAGFRHTLAGCGLNLAGFRELPDHFAFPPDELAKLEQWTGSLGKLAAVLCTRKDLVKIPRENLAGLPLWAVEVSLEVTTGREELEALLEPLARKVQLAP